MNTPRLAQCFGLALVVLTLGLPVVATPLKSPKRVVSERTIDLTPLFHWWTNRAGARPFPAWVHVTGKIVGTNGYSWVLEARVEGSKADGQEEGAENAKAGGNKRILLLHPPLQDRTAYEQLAAQLRTLEAQRTQATNMEAQLQRSLHSNSVNMRNFASKGTAWERQDLRVAERNTSAAKKQLDKQIQETKAKLSAWPNAGHYEVDCFALETSTAQSGMRVYEHGVGWP